MCCNRAGICARCRRCWVTPAFRPRRPTRTSISSTLPRPTTPRTRARARKAEVNRLILKAGREKSLKRRHPWVFSGAMAKVQGKPGPGETVGVWSATGEFLAVAAYSPESQIVARVWDWEDRAVDAAFFAERIGQAVAQRQALMGEAIAVRLVHGESDGLPGVVADRYGDTAVLQLNSAGAERWREAIADALLAAGGVTRVWE